MKQFLHKTAFFLFILFLVGNSLQAQIPNIFKEQQKNKTSKQLIDDPVARFNFEQLRTASPLTGKIPQNIHAKEKAFVNSAQAKLQPHSAVMGIEGNDNISWQQRGPYNVGGRTRALAIDVSNENNILAGGVSGGMWRSTNGGTSWTKVTEHNDFQSVTAIVQDTRTGHTDTWYYTTGEYSGNSAGARSFSANFHGNGVFKSTDGGQTWAQLSSTAQAEPHQFTNKFQYCWNVVVNPQNGDVYVATYGGIQRSTNGGSSWTEVLNGGNGGYSDIVCTTDGVFYATLSNDASPNKGVFRSTDGTTWVDITDTFNLESDYRRMVLAIAPSDENIIYMLIRTSDHQLMKYTYTLGEGTGDGTFGNGGKWTDLTSSMPSDYNSQGGYDMVVKIKPDNANVVIIGGTNLYRSTDGFVSTSNTTQIGGYGSGTGGMYTNHHPDQHGMVFLPSNPDVLFSSHDGGVSKTTNCLATNVSWQSLNNGYYTTQAYTVAFKENVFDDWTLSGFQDNSTFVTASTNATTDWTFVWGGDGSYCAFGDEGRSWYVSSQQGSTYLLRFDAQGNYQNYAGITPSSASGFLFVNPFILDHNNNHIMYMAGGRKVWRNSDLSQIPNGGNETMVNWESLTNANLPTGSVSTLAVSTYPANVLYVGSSRGAIYRLENANTGQPTAVDVFTGKGLPASGYVGSIFVDPQDADNVLVTFTNYEVKSIFHTTDGGQNWTSISGNLEENTDGSGSGPSVRSIAMFDNHNGEKIYFAGTSTGLYSARTLNGDNTVWTQEDADGIGQVVVEMVKTRYDGLVLLGTHGNGLFSANLEIAVKPEPSSYPADFQVVSTEWNSAQLTWTDAAGSQAPDGYLVKVATSADAISAPSDTQVLESGSDWQYVQQGIQTCTFTDLEPGTEYFFKIYPYTNQYNYINYKTDGSVPVANGTTVSVVDIATECFNGSSAPTGWKAENITIMGNGEVDFITASENPTGFSATNCSHFARFNSGGAAASDDQAVLEQTQSFSTQGYTDVSVRFDWTEDNGNSTSNDNMMVQWSTNGSDWTDADSFSRYNESGDAWHTKACALPSGAEGQTSLFVRFLFTSGAGNDCHLDNVKIQGVSDGTSPVNVTAATTSVDGTSIELTFSKAMNDPAGKHAEFAVRNNSNNNPVTAVALKTGGSQTFILTLTNAVAYGETVKLDYTKGTVTAQDAAELASFTDYDVTNAVIEPPVFVSARTANDGNSLDITFSKNMADPSGKQAEFTVSNGSAISISSIALKSGDNKTYTLSLGSTIAEDDAVTVSYTAGSVTSDDAGILASFQNESVSNTVSIFEISADSYYKVYPNPSSGKFQIHFVSEERMNFLIQIYDLNGKLVHWDSFYKDSNERLVDIDLSGKAAGIYQVKITTDIGSVSHKIIIK